MEDNSVTVVGIEFLVGRKSCMSRVGRGLILSMDVGAGNKNPEKRYRDPRIL
jgi:hypothetical protein